MKSNGREPQHEEKENSQERWLVSYADFITLMFAFFAVLYATSQKDVEKTKEFQESIKRYLIKAGAFGESGQQMNQGIKTNTVIEPPIQTYGTSRPETAQLIDEAEAFIETNITKAERQQFVMDVTGDDWGVRVVIPSSALFAPHSEKFRENALPFVSKLANLLAKTRRKILIEGHVAKNETGTYRSSWDFASARAVNMLRFIQRKENIAPAMLAAVSLGDTRPMFQKEKPEMNSRIEVVMLNQDYEF